MWARASGIWRKRREGSPPVNTLFGNICLSPEALAFLIRDGRRVSTDAVSRNREPSADLRHEDPLVIDRVDGLARHVRRASAASEVGLFRIVHAPQFAAHGVADRAFVRRRWREVIADPDGWILEQRAWDLFAEFDQA